VKRLTEALALIALAAGSVAVAQQSPSQTATPPSASPSTQYPSAQQSPGKEDSDTKAAKKEQIKNCMAQQQANNTGMSKHEMKKYCENQASGTSKNPPHD
jgi:hypothetical protein